VYAASEGLSVAVLDAQGYGGQAGASARIENYLGFPTGITGQALTGRAFVQAEKFGAEIIFPAAVRELVCLDGGGYRIELAEGESVTARTVVIASGARYRRPSIPRIAEFEGRGVWYWASPIEAKSCAATEVALVGGGNSAGQAAVFLSGHAAQVNLLIRGAELSKNMSRYLVDRIAATPNIRLLTETEITGLDGPDGVHLTDVTWTCRRTGDAETHPIRNLFLFVGADPETSWLHPCRLTLDRAGFVLTGSGVPGAAPAKPGLEASLPGVFAIGDVRAGSVKRVGAAIGEGAAVVAQIHAALAARAA
jgi:thioredoxin reductase (NADPH)